MKVSKGSTDLHKDMIEKVYGKDFIWTIFKNTIEKMQTIISKI